MKKINIDASIFSAMVYTEGDSTIQNEIPTVIDKDDYASVIDKTADLYEVGNPDNPNHGSQDGPAEELPDDLRSELNDLNPEVRPNPTAFQTQGNPDSLDQEEDPVYSEKGTEIDDYIKEKTDLNQAYVIDDHEYHPEDMDEQMEPAQKTDEELSLTSEPTDIVENVEDMVENLQVPGSGIDDCMKDLEDCLEKHSDIVDVEDEGEDVVLSNEAEEADIPEVEEDEEYKEETEAEADDVPAEVEEKADTDTEEATVEETSEEEIEADAQTEEAEEATGEDLDEDGEVGEDEDHAEAVEGAEVDSEDVEENCDGINCDEEQTIVSELEIAGIPEVLELPEEVELTPDTTTALDGDENVIASNLTEDASMEQPSDVQETETVEQGDIAEAINNVAAPEDVEEGASDVDAPAEETEVADEAPTDDEPEEVEEPAVESFQDKIRNFFKSF